MDKSKNKLPISFYEGDDVVEIARRLVGKVLVTTFGDKRCAGRIVEVEAYNGRTDKACHAYRGRRTKRTETMYQSGGRAYVYLCYGIHHLFNIVVNREGYADAVLIRALEPLDGHDIMTDRLKSKNKKLTNGPGILSKAMGITTEYDGVFLDGDLIWIENGWSKSANDIVATTRVGIDYAEEDALLPWRFYEKDNDWVSRK